MNTGIIFIASQEALDPGQLCLVKLIVRGIVERNEVYSALNPMVVRLKLMILRVVP